MLLGAVDMKMICAIRFQIYKEIIWSCVIHSSYQTILLYVSIYLIALGNGGYHPNIATFGADQFDEGDTREQHSKIVFFSYFYLALNIGSLFSNTILNYFEDDGLWTLGFWASAGSAALALVLFLCGTRRYRYFKPNGNPLPRFCQVFVAATRKWKVKVLQDDKLYEVDEFSTDEGRKMLHTEGFRYAYNSLSPPLSINLLPSKLVNIM